MWVWQSGYSQVELVSDKMVFDGFEMDACLWVPVDVKVRDVRFKRRVDFGHDGVPFPSNARPFPQFALLLNENTHEKYLDRIYSVTPCYVYRTTHICLVTLHVTLYSVLTYNSKNGWLWRAPKINFLQMAKNIFYKTIISMTRGVYMTVSNRWPFSQQLWSSGALLRDWVLATGCAAEWTLCRLTSARKHTRSHTDK